MPVWIAVSESEWKANPDKVKKTTYLTETVYIEERYKGQVLHEFERNYHDDSDFYAKIWDPVAGQSFDYMWGTTRGWTYANGCQPDALPEYRAAYEAEQAAKAKAREDATIRVGKEIKVVRGRKHLGKTGRVFWKGPKKNFGGYPRYKSYAPTLTEYRLGIETADGERFFIDQYNCQTDLKEAS